MAQPGRDRVGTTGLGAQRQRLRHACDKAWAFGDSALGAHTTRPGSAHDKDVRTTNLSSSQKKKNDPRDLKRLSLVSELRYTNT